MLYGGKLFSSKVTKNMNAGHAQRGRDGARRWRAGPRRTAASTKYPSATTSAESRMPGTWLNSPVSSSMPVSPGEDEHPEDAERAPGAGERRSTSAAPLGDGRDHPASRGTTDRSACGSVMRRRYGRAGAPQGPVRTRRGPGRQPGLARSVRGGQNGAEPGRRGGADVVFLALMEPPAATPIAAITATKSRTCGRGRCRSRSRRTRSDGMMSRSTTITAATTPATR